MSDYLPAPAALLSFLRSAHAFFATASPASLLFLAGIFYYARQRAAGFAGAGCRGVAKALGVLSLLAFGLTEYAAVRSYDEEVTRYLTIAIQAAFLLVIVEGAVTTALACLKGVWPVLTVPHALYRRIAFWLRRDDSWLFRVVAWFWRLVRRPFQRQPPPSPPPPPPPTLRSILEQARQEFDATCENLRSAGFDDDELESALLFARQKYLRRVHNVMKQ